MKMALMNAKKGFYIRAIKEMDDDDATEEKIKY